MNFNFIRIIDKYLGTLLCFLLTIIRYFFKIFINKRKRLISPVKKILFVKFIEQGSTVIAYDAVSKAVNLVNKENVFFIVFEGNDKIIKILDNIPHENIFIIRSRNFLLFIIDIIRNIIKIKRKKIDTIIDLEFFAKASAIFSFLCFAKRRVGFHDYSNETGYRGDLLTHRLQYNPYVHVSKIFSIMIESLKADLNDKPICKFAFDNIDIKSAKVKIEDHDKEKIKTIVESEINRKLDEKIIIINPNASDLLPLRKWPLENFIGLCKQILENNKDILLVLTGTGDEIEASKKILIELNSSRIISLAGKTNLQELIALYSISRVIITNDSGPAHFASLTDINIITLFGPETPVLYSPLGDKVNVIYRKLFCSPCINVYNYRFSPCKDNVCMKSISIEEVYKRLMSIL